MDEKSRIPRPTAKRLTLYFRQIRSLAADGRKTINSRQLGEALGLTGAQVRKDLACFGQFGHPGVGYQISSLYEQLRQLLGRDRTWNAVLVGAGNIGRALLSYDRFSSEDFRIVAVCDADPALVGSQWGGREVLSMDRIPSVVREHDAKLGIIAVPDHAAQEVADLLVEAGIEGILNFSPRRLDVDQTVSISSVDFTRSLEQLAFQISFGVTGTVEDD